MEGSGHGLFEGTVQEFDWGDKKTMKNLSQDCGCQTVTSKYRSQMLFPEPQKVLHNKAHTCAHAHL
jgi:hypothetical protein